MSSIRPIAPRPYRVVGRYRIYSELASGGMATVYLGCLIGSAGFSKLVAIKSLHEHFALESQFVAMFLDEARLASTIHHPNVVSSLDVVAEQGELLVVMEYVHGETLAGLLRLARATGDLPSVPVVARVVADALEGLHAAHAASLAGRCLNIVHRDVSPQNIMVGADGNTRVLDFGIAQAAVRSQVTAAGTVKGKVSYMSPEQVRGRSVDARTDVFAAGVVLWEALTGQRLFFAPDSRDTVDRVLHAPIPPPSSVVPTLPAALDAVVLKALARGVGQRFASAHEFAEALRAVAGEGSRREVAQWVGRVAKDTLAQRLQMLEALEASAAHTQAAVPLTRVTSLSPVTTPTPDDVPTRATTTTSILPPPPRARWLTAAPWLFAAVGVVAAVLVWLTVRRDTALAPPTRPALQVAAAPVPPAPLTPKLAPRASPDSELPVVEADSMSLAEEPELPKALPKKPVTPNRPPARPAQAIEPVSTAPQVSNAAPVSPCIPPYRVDAAGVRRIKAECL